MELCNIYTLSQLAAFLVELTDVFCSFLFTFQRSSHCFTRGLQLHVIPVERVTFIAQAFSILKWDIQCEMLYQMKTVWQPYGCYFDPFCTDKPHVPE